jgi:hypothetical protein
VGHAPWDVLGLGGVLLRKLLRLWNLLVALLK